MKYIKPTRWWVGSNVAPALQQSQVELEKHRLQDALQHKISDRPNPEELVKQGILTGLHTHTLHRMPYRSTNKCIFLGLCSWWSAKLTGLISMVSDRSRVSLLLIWIYFWIYIPFLGQMFRFAVCMLRTCMSWHAKKAFRDHVSIYGVVRLART